MTKQTNGSNPKSSKGDPNRDVQPWLGWIAALLVVVIVVVAVAMGMERTNSQRDNAAEVRMTPLVGGMVMPVATETGVAVALASEITPAPAAISGTSSITMVTVITSTNDLTSETAAGSTSEVTATSALTATGGITPTNDTSTTVTITDTSAVQAHPSMTNTSEVTATVQVSPEVTASPLVTKTPEVTATPLATATEATSATLMVTTTPEVQPTFTVTPTETPAKQPTATPATIVQRFEAGDKVVPSGGRVEIYADTSADTSVLDSYGPGAVLEVLDPDGDVAKYPVIVDGESWLRVRAADGLVGWVKASQVEVQ